MRDTYQNNGHNGQSQTENEFGNQKESLTRRYEIEYTHIGYVVVGFHIRHMKK